MWAQHPSPTTRAHKRAVVRACAPAHTQAHKRARTYARTHSTGVVNVEAIQLACRVAGLSATEGRVSRVDHAVAREVGRRANVVAGVIAAIVPGCGGGEADRVRGERTSARRSLSNSAKTQTGGGHARALAGVEGHRAGSGGVGQRRQKTLEHKHLPHRIRQSSSHASSAALCLGTILCSATRRPHARPRCPASPARQATTSLRRSAHAADPPLPSTPPAPPSAPTNHLCAV